MELTESEQRLLIREGGSGVKYRNRMFYMFSGSVNSLLNSLHWHAHHGTLEDSHTAKNLLLKVIWYEHENFIASCEGWIISRDEVTCSVLNRGRSAARFNSDEEAASHVKEAAARGDVLAQKAIVEIARRRLNGNNQNDRLAQARNSQ